MRKWKVMLLALAVGAWSASAQAATITFASLLGAGGTLSYDGAGGAMIGGSIGLDTVVGGGTPSNAGVILACVGCELSFTTGGNTLEGPPVWTFGGNAALGSFTITGSIPLLGISGTLLTGSVAIGSALNFGQLTGSVLGPDIKRPELVAFYGLTGYEFTYANTDIVLTPTIGADGSFTGTVETATVTNTATTPVPEYGSTMTLLGLGLLGLGTLRRKFLV
jgi:hypothetical protein